MGTRVRSGPTVTGSDAQGGDELAIKSLTFPKLDPVEVGRRIGTFNLGQLHVLVDRADLKFAFGLVDDRGRVANQPILTHLGWAHRTSLTPTIGRNFLIIHVDDNGDPLIDHRMRVMLPQAMLRLCGLDTGRQVLMVASGVGDVLIVHPLVNLAHMIRQFHGANAIASPSTDSACNDGK